MTAASDASATLVEPKGGCDFSMPGVIICRPRYLAHHVVTHCPICERRRRMVRTWEMWYGDTVYCLTCGERWEDGERSERPFRRGWREDNLRHARRLSAEALPKAQFLASMRAVVDDYLRDVEDDASGEQGAQR